MRVAIIGFGFSGAMVAANLVRGAERPLELFLISLRHDARGVAYGTEDTHHLLNMRARNMGAFDGDGPHFYHWLVSGAGKTAAAARGLSGTYGEMDFAPRALYGDYLEAIWKETQTIAEQKRISIKLVPTRAVAIRKDSEALAVLTERGDAIAAEKVVVATGHESRTVLPQLVPAVLIQNPWDKDAIGRAKASDGPIVLLGAGLTAVDMILSLRAEGYDGEIIALSRRGLLPQPHRQGLKEYALDKEALLAAPSLVAMMRHFRRIIAQHEAEGGDWREVMDAVRPHLQRLWMKLTLRDQQRFLERLLPYWNVHRHRMAPSIDLALRAEIEAGHLRTMSYRTLTASMEGDRAKLEVTKVRGVSKSFSPSMIINCIGPELRVQRSGQNLLKQLLADELAEAPPNGIGLAADMHCRLYGHAHPDLFAVGSLLMGQLLESTGVPELRVQAATIARRILGPA